MPELRKISHSQGKSAQAKTVFSEGEVSEDELKKNRLQLRLLSLGGEVC